MTNFISCRSVLLPLFRCILASSLAVSCFAFGQVYYPNQEIRIPDLPSLTARSANASDVLLASAEITFRDKKICCGMNSALQDSIQSADPMSLKDVAEKLQGRHLLSDGHPITVVAEYLSPDVVSFGQLVGSLAERHPLLMQWNSHLYVVYGVVFDRTVDYSTGARMDAIRKLLLLDTQFPDKRREVRFNRQTDDWSKVQGLLILTSSPQ